jgi:Carboxypeptidase regulatory-like domain
MRSAALFWSALIGAFAMLAQSERGTITGDVRDVTGAVAPGASIHVTNVATNMNLVTTSNASGDFIMPDLPVGTY